MLYFLFFLFSETVQILKTEYKYGQYCTPLTQSDCRYFFVLAISIVIAWYRIQYDKIFFEFLTFCGLISRAFRQVQQQQYMRNEENIAHTVGGKCSKTSLSLAYEVSIVC